MRKVEAVGIAQVLRDGADTVERGVLLVVGVERGVLYKGGAPVEQVEDVVFADGLVEELGERREGVFFLALREMQGGMVVVVVDVHTVRVRGSFLAEAFKEERRGDGGAIKRVLLVNDGRRILRDRHFCCCRRRFLDGGGVFNFLMSVVVVFS